MAQPSYAPPPWSAAPATPKTSGLAIASLVLGILWLYWIGSILAVIFGAIAIHQINQSNGWKTGKGMAVAGLVLGIVGSAIMVVVFMAVAAVESDYDYNTQTPADRNLCRVLEDRRVYAEPGSPDELAIEVGMEAADC